MKQYIYLALSTLLCLIGGAQPQTIIVNPQNDTAVLNGTVTMTCRFNEPVLCAWQRNGQSVHISNRYQYVNQWNGQQPTDDCSITIRSVAPVDVAPWLCMSLANDNSAAVKAELAFLSIQKTPSNPTVIMNDKQINELNILNAPETLCCQALNGNPATILHWEVNNSQYIGPTPDIRQVEANVYDTILCWNMRRDWTVLENARSLRCIANHKGYSNNVAFIEVKIQRNEATSFVHLTHANGSFLQGNVTVSDGNSQTFHCIANGHPPPLYKWEFKSPSEDKWNEYRDDQNITVQKDGAYRCVARNVYNDNFMYSSSTITYSAPSAEASNMGMIAGIIIGVLAFLSILGIIFAVYWKKRKSGSHITEGSNSTEKGGQDEQEAEKLTKVAPNTDECVYENVKQSDKEDEMNGKIESSPLKADQNENKKPEEVVYAQLDLSVPKNTKPKTGTPEYEKTEYAELNFNNALNNKTNQTVTTPTVTTQTPAVTVPVTTPTPAIVEES